jgi:hypothetical protein
MAVSIVTVKTDVKVDASGLSKTMVAYAAVMGKAMGEVSRQQAGLLCQDMLDYTLPFNGRPTNDGGIGRAAELIGRTHLDHDIDSIFRPLYKATYGDIAGQSSPSVFVAWTQEKKAHNESLPWFLKKGYSSGYGDWIKFQEDYKGKGRTRKKSADFTGAYSSDSFIKTTFVSTRGGTSVPNYGKNVKKSDKVYFVGEFDSKMSNLKKTQKNKIGRLKSGWYEAGLMLGRKMKAGNWIAQNASGNGIVVDNSRNTTSPTVTVGNKIQMLMNQEPASSLWKVALNHRAYSMRNQILQKLKRQRGMSGQRFEKIISDLEIQDGFEVKNI